MSTYAIGDVQGCYRSLCDLLENISFGNEDALWLVGDLVNRGPDSQKVIELVKGLGKRATMVLGNHDICLIACYYNAWTPKPYDTMQSVAHGDKADELIHWLRQQKLMHTDLGYTMVHAGIYPWWDLKKATTHAKEVEAVLQDEVRLLDFVEHLFGNAPHKWSESLTGSDRLRFIINSFTRMRTCHADGRLNLDYKGPPSIAPDDVVPWFSISDRQTTENKLIFGHWASLNGETGASNTFALDTGCVWGRKLTAMRLEDQKHFHVPTNPKDQ